MFFFAACRKQSDEVAGGARSMSTIRGWVFYMPKISGHEKTVNPKKSSEPLAFQEHSKSGFGPSSD